MATIIKSNKWLVYYILTKYHTIPLCQLNGVQHQHYSLLAIFKGLSFKLLNVQKERITLIIIINV